MMGARPSIAVAIPTFNQAMYVSLAVESALDQYGVEPEVWVSDDASTDGTMAALEKFTRNPRVHIHRQVTNKGIALNAGWIMSRPRSDYIVRLDSDDFLEPSFCARLSALLESNPKAAVAHCAVREIDAKGHPARVRRLARKSGYQNAEEALRGAAAGYRVAANICMFRKTAIDSLPFVFKEGLNFCEDWDLYARLAASGWGNVYSSSVLANYRVWKDGAGLRAFRREAEILGIKHVIGSTLSDAWKKRGWPASELESALISFACIQSKCLLDLSSDSLEYNRLRLLMEDLSGNKIEILDQHLNRMKRCGRWGVFLDRSKLYLFDFCKAVFYR